MMWFWKLVFYRVVCLSVKYSGVWSLVLCGCLVSKDLWMLIGYRNLSFRYLFLQTSARMSLLVILPIVTYIGVFYLHLNTLTKAGPHDNIMTSAFQASLEVSFCSFIFLFTVTFKPVYINYINRYIIDLSHPYCHSSV